MADADSYCADQNDKIAGYELTKQNKIVASCSDLTQDELCGTTGNGLNFALMNARCLALNPQSTCNDFYLAVRSGSASGCGGGKYRLMVTKPGNNPPVLVADDVSP